MSSLSGGQTFDLIHDTMKVALFSDKMPQPDYSVPAKYGKMPFIPTFEVGDPPGGIELTGKTLTLQNGLIIYDADDAVWNSSTISNIGHGFVYDASLSNNGVFHVDFGGSFSTTAGTFTINWDASGMFTIDLDGGLGERLIYPKTWELA